MENNLEKSIVEYLIDKKEVTSVDIAQTFLKFKAPNEQVAKIPVEAVLKRIRGISKNEKGLWCFDDSVLEKSSSTFLELPWVIITILTTNKNEPLCVAVGYLEAADENKVFWLKNPDELDEEIQSILRSGNDLGFQSVSMSVDGLANAISGKWIITRSYREQGMFARLLNDHYYYLPDDTYLLSSLLKAADMKSDSKIENISEVYKTYYGEFPVNNSASEVNRTYTYVIAEILKKLEASNIKSIDDLINKEIEKNFLASWKYLDKSIQDIASIEKVPGVYGFTDKDGKYLYIGKAKNLQKRLLSYFRLSEESPEKLRQLRDKAYGLTIYKCGSELESLLYEQRLIVKYKPVLNRKVDLSERKGFFTYLKDSIIILPHSMKEMVMAIWVRKDQKIRIKSISKDDINSKLENELNTFFYSDKLEPNPSDFQELEIVNRWMSRNRDTVMLIDVDRYSNSNELMNQIMCELGSFPKSSL